MELKNLTVTEFAAVTASDAPAPGGGSISALAGCLAATLGEMVANLTSGRAKYADSQEDMDELLRFLPAVHQKLLDAVDRDSSAFDQFMAALSLPKNTEEEKALRKKAMQAGRRVASKVPMEVAEASLSLFPYLEKAVLKGNPNAVTDGMVGTMLARTAVMGALFNVRVNLESIQDEKFVSELSKKCDELQKQALDWETKILSQKPNLSGI